MSRAQTVQEERINTITHGLMAILLIGALPFTIQKFLNRGGAAAWRDTAAVGVFCLCLILMFSSSAIYHGLPQESRFKRLFNRFDHMAIYFAIAGSYTPIAISVIGGRTGLVVLLIQWFLVLAGILFKVFVFNKNLLTRIVSVALYLAMGWTLAICFPVLVANALPACLWLILAGGLFYTVGVIFYARKGRFSHVIWHFFVNAGAISHFIAIVFFLKP